MVFLYTFPITLLHVPLSSMGKSLFCSNVLERKSQIHKSRKGLFQAVTSAASRRTSSHIHLTSPSSHQH
jgi:hypothetical protein